MGKSYSTQYNCSQKANKKNTNYQRSPWYYYGCRDHMVTYLHPVTRPSHDRFHYYVATTVAALYCSLCPTNISVCIEDIGSDHQADRCDGCLKVLICTREIYLKFDGLSKINQLFLDHLNYKVGLFRLKIRQSNLGVEHWKLT